MNWEDIPRILKGVFTMKNISDDEVKLGVSFIFIVLLIFIGLILIM